jgi:hypothetical protein
MKASRASEDRGHRTRRTPRVLVTDPLLTVVESPEAADPTALDDALELFVRWAVRAHKRGRPAATEAPTDENSATYGSEK